MCVPRLVNSTIRQRDIEIRRQLFSFDINAMLNAFKNKIHMQQGYMELFWRKLFLLWYSFFPKSAEILKPHNQNMKYALRS